MLDKKWIRQNPKEFAQHLKKRNVQIDTHAFFNALEQSQKLQTNIQQLQNKRNEAAKQIGKAKSQGQNIENILKENQSFKEKIVELKTVLEQTEAAINQYHYAIPNILDKSVPIGVDEHANQVIRTWGKVPKFDFPICDHLDLIEKIGFSKQQKAVKMSASRFCLLQGDLVRLKRALTQFMIDTHRDEHGYQETYIPYIVNQNALFGTGQLPKFKEDLFEVNFPAYQEDFYLIPTAEVPLTNLAAGCIFENTELPLSFVAHSPCFRSEAGSYGKDTKGLIRQHQFEKVELVHLCEAKDSSSILEQLAKHAEVILQKLNLPYRTMILCSGDTGFGSSKTYDIEVWMPSQNCYREISSCSNMTDFQSRRIQARVKTPSGNELIHTLNGSGLAVGRALIAVIENYQNADGTIDIPSALRPYMKKDRIGHDL